jgi:hypothetical protein
MTAPRLILKRLLQLMGVVTQVAEILVVEIQAVAMLAAKPQQPALKGQPR